ncbi:tetratricopeptide repeat protein [Roseomonas sp. NAR14]|uniref:Tetratricopeptide repeat protein n=1 Tax=Roseomonas acroporae TaxID=2937791 RepID=A0A9X1Y970_9PROT|nr:tetratricopeptide repeat protein [Roseomonas acroporae]MCK8785395.1 tetratricopeptide repeat protein [Roseomonas acroporae]
MPTDRTPPHAPTRPPAGAPRAPAQPPVRPPARSLAVALALAASLAVAPAARAQMESREGIALQNQLLQLRQEMEQLRRSGGGGGAPMPAPGYRPAPGGNAGEIVGQLLERVGQLEEEVRRLRGRAEEAEYRNRQLQQAVEKLQGDMDYRLGQIEGRGGDARPDARPPAAPPREAPPAAPPAAAASPGTSLGAPPPRTPERAIADGRAALGRGDYTAAEAAAREAMSRGPRSADAQLLLAEAQFGQRNYQAAAVSFDDAYRRNRQGSRAPDALLGLANSFIGLGARREACDTLDQLRTEFPRLGGAQAQQANAARQRASCR